MDLAIAFTPDDENPDKGDLRLVNGQLVLTDGGSAAGSEGTAQRILVRLRWFLGEYFLDASLGVPWFQVVFQKGTSDELIDSIVRRSIRTTEGVVSVDRMSLERDAAARTLTIDADVRIETGEIVAFRGLDLFADILTES
jgi:hypothetical protein